jgi:hypothetical protein
MIEKQWFGCSVSWSAESWPENGTNQARFSMALYTKTTLLHDIEPIAIPIKTIPNHSWDVSRAFVILIHPADSFLISISSKSLIKSIDPNNSSNSSLNTSSNLFSTILINHPNEPNNTTKSPPNNPLNSSIMTTPTMHHQNRYPRTKNLR